MQFHTLSFAAVLALTAGLVHGSPAARDESLVISHVIPVGEYNLTYWTDAPGAVARAPVGLPRVCGTDNVICSTGAAASASICSQLITTLTNNAGTVIGDSPRAVCLGQSGNECCVSWSNAVGPMIEGNLISAATLVYNSCLAVTELNMSGLARNVILNGGCVTQCLSNRPGGCTNS
jgi:hypothetical protein